MTAKDDARPQQIDPSAIARLNDRFRTTGVEGMLVATAGVIQLAQGALTAIVAEVRAFDAFTSDNDPYGEHDFGALAWRGTKLFWKIDCYDRNMRGASPDAADPSVTLRVLTVMLASEY
ncbi:DUF3768 domain-containing protein [Sphingomonas rubra]|uniref:DUF3768 domain-containing protein n=1 Tax=Sphingomonas rubra TaxID=634430 RepID=A0A1I5QGR8_9SPHN|nr:DUF3768 domain-containing protein [Sphingomonas rubra]SFP45499.1 Protein of unknown function [Sphingomonas rubra]